MPKSLAHIISLSFIPIIFAEGHIMNSPFVAIVPLYALVVRRTVYEAGIGSLILQGWSVYYHTYVPVCVATHNGVDPGAANVTRPSQ